MALDKVIVRAVLDYRNRGFGYDGGLIAGIECLVRCSILLSLASALWLMDALARLYLNELECTLA